MSLLKPLSFAALPKTQINPTFDRRNRTVARLEEQKALLKDTSFVRKVRSFVKKEGVRTLVENDQRVLPWWKVAPDGSILFAIRIGSKTVEFEKGKAAVAVASIDKLPMVIDTLIAATKAGELDVQLAQSSKPPQTKKR